MIRTDLTVSKVRAGKLAIDVAAKRMPLQSLPHERLIQVLNHPFLPTDVISNVFLDPKMTDRSRADMIGNITDNARAAQALFAFFDLSAKDLHKPDFYSETTSSILQILGPARSAELLNNPEWKDKDHIPALIHQMNCNFVAEMASAGPDTKWAVRQAISALIKNPPSLSGKGSEPVLIYLAGVLNSDKMSDTTGGNILFNGVFDDKSASIFKTGLIKPERVSAFVFADTQFLNLFYGSQEVPEAIKTAAFEKLDPSPVELFALRVQQMHRAPLAWLLHTAVKDEKLIRLITHRVLNAPAGFRTNVPSALQSLTSESLAGIISNAGESMPDLAALISCESRNLLSVVQDRFDNKTAALFIAGMTTAPRAVFLNALLKADERCFTDIIGEFPDTQVEVFLKSMASVK
ncbi:MAG: hypothetical protein NTZ10_00970 [Candidatus Saganbacteria bacterium]|nr:hypothetical protein [Candidatus Saganbacteria bacterium]